MKIALLLQIADPDHGGAEGYTLNLARSLADRGHQVTLIAERGTPPESGEPFIRCYLGSRGATRWARMRHFLDALQSLPRSHDIVHAMLPVRRCDVYQPHSGMAADLLLNGHLKYTGKIVQNWSRGFNACHPKRRGQADVERRLVTTGAPPWLLAMSDHMRHFARRHYDYPAERIAMLRCGVELSRFNPDDPHAGGRVRSRFQIPAGQPLGVLIGHDWKRKGAAEAIKALALLGPDSQQLKLMFVGRDNPEPYRKLAAYFGVADRVIFAGAARDPHPCLAAADFFILPTRQDTCSIVVLEALVMGLPVITTLQNGACELIENGREGLLVNRGDIAALTAALRQMLDPARRASMARAAFSMREQLSHDQHVSQIEEVYQTVIAERVGSSRAHAITAG